MAPDTTGVSMGNALYRKHSTLAARALLTWLAALQLLFRTFSLFSFFASLPNIPIVDPCGGYLECLSA